MIKRLKENIEVKLGRKIRSRGDCQFLSNRITEELNESISYNTIRRAFGVESGCAIKPRVSTLNILSQFIGCKSFDDFYKETDWLKEWSSQIRISGWIDRMDDQEIIGNLTTAWFKNDNFSISFVSILRELFLLGKIQLIDKIFKKSAFEFDKLTYSEILYIGNGVGSIVRKMKMSNEDLAILLKNKRFFQYIFLSFVDYSSLFGYYGSLPAVADQYNVRLKSDQKLFFKAILRLKNLLANIEIASIGYKSIKKQSLHPILIGRLASMEIAARIQKEVSYDYVLNDITERMQLSGSNQMNYLYELKTVSLISGDFFLMEWICSVENIYVKEEYQVSHEQYLFIVRLFLAIHKKKDSEIGILLKKIDKMKWILSYYSFFEVFTCIAMYHVTNNFKKRKKILQRYNALCMDLKYTLLNESYLLKYFEEQ